MLAVIARRAAYFYFPCLNSLLAGKFSPLELWHFRTRTGIPGALLPRSTPTPTMPNRWTPNSWRGRPVRQYRRWAKEEELRAFGRVFGLLHSRAVGDPHRPALQRGTSFHRLGEDDVSALVEDGAHAGVADARDAGADIGPRRFGGGGPSC